MTVSVRIHTCCSVRWLVAVVAAAVLCGAHPAESQEADAKITVDLGNGDGPPGRTLSIPMNIAIPAGTKTTEFEVDVRFEKNLLSFVRAELAPQGKSDGIKLTTTAEDDPSSDTRSILRIKAVGEQPLGSGAVADLFFRINPKAKPPTGGTGHKAAKFTALLKKEARVKIGEGKLILAGGRDGEIDITEGVALFGCFFYMH